MKTEMNDRIRLRRLQLDLTQLQLAKAIGVSRVSVTKWESGITKPDGENLHRLAQTLSCTPEWILYGTGDLRQADDTNLMPATVVPTAIPIISSVQAGVWTDTFSAVGISDVLRWCSTTVKVSDSAFALDVRGESMTNPNGLPSIPEGSTVIVEPNYGSIEDLYGKIVVVIIDGSSETTIKKLVVDGPNKYLMPLNPNFKPIEIKGNYRILGKVVQVTQDL
ncbi:MULTISPECIES: LexA family protein [Yersinia pseudotuberculosis complex]|nr:MULTISPECIES: S24 family peptidase [Yersinia pseudotuberculosis complex]AJK16709.1 repressor protein C2 [Yersinia pseudotuberculosis str. PA3606]MCE4113747.1 helix-turn-helix domain-containing protein [Yersinia pseudotuberculosis]MCF1165063.1 helix-turn-helix domain-containing protein [Yersinia pseudotuberculosis]WLF02227.1 S24 family peptidase [Yersinia pseudotuberculosis]